MQDVVIDVIDIPAVGRYNESTELRNDDSLRQHFSYGVANGPKFPAGMLSKYLVLANLSLYRTVDV
jgi:hypothetical protein